MRSFDQLSQDEQMEAVEAIVDMLIDVTANGYIPKCLSPHQSLVESILAISPPDLAKDRLLQALLAKREMYVPVLHQAGRIAKAAYYP